jgi:hypothetical protein
MLAGLAFISYAHHRGRLPGGRCGRHRDSWLLDRATIQPGSIFADRIKAGFTAQLRAIRDAESVDDLFQRLEDAGALLRIGPAIRPTAYPDDTVKNRLCVPLPHPDTDLDWLRIAVADYGNQLRWLGDPDLTAWLAAARLDLFGHLMGHLLAPVSAKPRVRDRILSITKSALSATATKLDQLMLACNPR